MNEQCRTCAHGRNCINGRWCEKLRKYVQYDKKPLCEDGNKSWQEEENHSES